MQDCNISSAIAKEILQSCTEPSLYQLPTFQVPHPPQSFNGLKRGDHEQEDIHGVNILKHFIEKELTWNGIRSIVRSLSSYLVTMVGSQDIAQLICGGGICLLWTFGRKLSLLSLFWWTYLHFTESEWRIHAWVNWAILCSDNGLVPKQHNASLLLPEP